MRLGLAQPGLDQVNHNARAPAPAAAQPGVAKPLFGAHALHKTAGVVHAAELAVLRGQLGRVVRAKFFVLAIARTVGVFVIGQTLLAAIAGALVASILPC